MTEDGVAEWSWLGRKWLLYLSNAVIPSRWFVRGDGVSQDESVSDIGTTRAATEGEFH